MEAMKKPTITDNIVIAWLKLLPIPRNHLFVIVVQMVGITDRTKNLEHGIEIGVRNTVRGPETPEYSCTVLRITDKGITPCRAINRCHGSLS